MVRPAMVRPAMVRLAMVRPFAKCVCRSSAGSQRTLRRVTKPHFVPAGTPTKPFSSKLFFGLGTLTNTRMGEKQIIIRENNDEIKKTWGNQSGGALLARGWWSVGWLSVIVPPQRLISGRPPTWTGLLVGRPLGRPSLLWADSGETACCSRLLSTPRPLLHYHSSEAFRFLAACSFVCASV